MAGPRGNGAADPKAPSPLTPPPALRAMWTDFRSSRASVKAELERQKRMHSEESDGVRFLSWAERQRLVDAPAPPLWPMLVAIGMLCVVSMSLTVSGNETEPLKATLIREEAPFVPHEAELRAERLRLQPGGQEVAVPEDEGEGNLSLLHKKREYLSKDEGDKSLEWLEKPLPLGDLLLKGKDSQVLLTEASSQLAPLVKSLIKQARDLKLRTRGNYKLHDLLQQDLIAVGELMLLCRIMREGGKLSGEDAKRLMELFRLVAKRFSIEWPEALTLTRYCADERQCYVYLRLVGLVASAADAAGKYFLLGHGKGQQDGRSPTEMNFSKKVMTARLELQRALDQARFSSDIADSFRTD